MSDECLFSNPKALTGECCDEPDAKMTVPIQTLLRSVSGLIQSDRDRIAHDVDVDYVTPCRGRPAILRKLPRPSVYLDLSRHEAAKCLALES